MAPHGLWGLIFGWVLAAQPVLTPVAPPPAHPPVFPVRGDVHYSAYHHDYPAVDIFARCGSRAVSPVDGTVLELSRTDRWDPATDRGAVRGGLSYSVRGRDGVRYYGSHLRSLRPGLRAGDTVTAGETLGHVGNTGDAAGIACHLHFGISPVCRGTGDWQVRRGAVNPYPFLRSWQQGGHRSPVAAARHWQRHHRCR